MGSKDETDVLTATDATFAKMHVTFDPLTNLIMTVDQV